MSKALALSPALPILPGDRARDDFSFAILRVRQFHQIAKRAGEQMVLAAIFAGMELLQLQNDLKKYTRCNFVSGGKLPPTFTEWLESRAEEFGFAQCTAFKYMRLFQGMKSKMLKAKHGQEVVALLDKSPSAMSERQAETLALAMAKSVDGESLSELYVELGITRLSRKAVLNQLTSPGRPLGSTNAEPNADLLIQDELFGRFKVVDDILQVWGRPLKIGASRVHTWEAMTTTQKRDASHWLDITITKLTDMRSQLEAVRK